MRISPFGVLLFSPGNRSIHGLRIRLVLPPLPNSEFWIPFRPPLSIVRCSLLVCSHGTRGKLEQYFVSAPESGL